MSFSADVANASPVKPVQFRGHSLYVKRDDLVGRSALTGNKARKLHYYLENDFPDVSTLVSYGSVQSNMLYSLSILAQIKGWALEFYVDHIPENLASNPRGNYGAALTNGAKINVVGSNDSVSGSRNIETYLHQEVLPGRDEMLYIPEGGSNEEAELGIKVLAEELNTWVKKSSIENPKLMLPSGTGTTALFLQKHLPFEVLTCACVGSADYLITQFSKLDNNKKYYPTILPAICDRAGIPRKFHFGKLYPELFALWHELGEETGITFELLYDPLGWMTMLEYLRAQKVSQKESSFNLIYVHQGGILGNETMIERYKRKMP